MAVHPEIVVSVIGLFGLVLFFIPFLYYVKQDFQRIKTTYSTISAFSAAPGEWPNRFLCCVTLISGYSLFILFFSEYSNPSHLISDWEFGLQTTLSMLLPLIGIWHTDGSGRFLYYICGPPQNRLSIRLSTCIHSLSALGFMLIMPVLHLRFVFRHYIQTPFMIVMVILTVLDAFILVTFLTLQSLIALPLMVKCSVGNNICCVHQTETTGPHASPCQLCPEPDHNAELHCNACSKSFCLWQTFTHGQLCGGDLPLAVLEGISTPDLSQVHITKIPDNSRDALFIASFTLEACLVVLTLGLTATLSLARNSKLGWL